MVRIEELPPDVDMSPPPASSKANATPPKPPSSKPSPSTSSNGIPSSMLDQVTPFPAKEGLPPNPLSDPTAAMPPAMASTKSYTADELITLLNRTPLFMTELDEGDGAGGENMDLEALKALAYEGTRAENAENFRQQGNELAKIKQWEDAREFYTKALEALKMEMEPREGRLDGGEGPTEVDWLEEGQSRVKDVEEEHTKEKEIEEVCYVNRALCNLEMKNYGSCNRDCAAAIRLNPKNVKAYYRSGQACLAIDKIEAASDACTRALALEPQNKSIAILVSKIEERQEILQKQERARLERLRREQEEKMAIKKALALRKISTKMTNEAPADVEDAKIQLADPLDAESVLSFPTILLYPTHAQSDVIKAFQETDAVSAHLQYIFPCPWDERREFTVDTVECYMDTVAGGLIKLGKNVVLGTVLAGGKVQITDGMCKIYVVPKTKASDWIQDVKRRRRG